MRPKSLEPIYRGSKCDHSDVLVLFQTCPDKNVMFFDAHCTVER